MFISSKIPQAKAQINASYRVPCGPITLVHKINLHRSAFVTLAPTNSRNRLFQLLLILSATTEVFCLPKASATEGKKSNTPTLCLGPSLEAQFWLKMSQHSPEEGCPGILSIRKNFWESQPFFPLSLMTPHSTLQNSLCLCLKLSPVIQYNLLWMNTEYAAQQPLCVSLHMCQINIMVSSPKCSGQCQRHGMIRELDCILQLSLVVSMKIGETSKLGLSFHLSLYPHHSTDVSINEILLGGRVCK